MADYAALEKYETFKATDGVRDPRLPSDLGVVHSMRRRSPMPGHEPEYFRRDPLHAECGAAVRVRLPMRFDAEDPDACAECAAFVRGDKPRPRFGAPPRCYATARHDDDQLAACVLSSRHKGSHRTSAGEVWEDGSKYVSPAPDGFV